jgi:hypothetical protein
MDRFQLDINPRMRTILIDLSQNRINRNQLQLIGVTAMFIASKYEVLKKMYILFRKYMLQI